jgi:hypothetical protein
MKTEIQALPPPSIQSYLITILSDYSKMHYIATNLQNDEDVKGTEHMWLHTKLKTSFTGDIRKLME